MMTMLGYITLAILILLLLIGIFTDWLDKLFDKLDQWEEAKSREKYPAFWAAQDELDKCLREEAKAERHLKAIKAVINTMREEMKYLPEEEAEKIRTAPLYKMRLQYFKARCLYNEACRNTILARARLNEEKKLKKNQKRA